MSAIEITRTWTATIEVYVPAERVSYSIQAEQSPSDLLRDQTVSAVRESVALLDEGAVTVSLWKTTKARGTEKDRTFTVFRDWDGQVRYQR